MRLFCLFKGIYLLTINVSTFQQKHDYIYVRSEGDVFYALAQGTDSGDPVTLHHEKNFQKEFLEMFNEALDELDTHPAPSEVGEYLCRAYGFQEIEIETGVVCYCAP